MTSGIEQKLNLFLQAVCDGKANITDSLIEEFGNRCERVLRESFIESQERKFTIRMSNIGRSLRRLMLDRDSPDMLKPDIEWKLKATVGHIYEAFVLTLLKSSGVNVEAQDEKVSYLIDDIELQGTFDVQIDGKIYDIKTASDYAFDKKFCNLETLRDGDSFGYFAQGFGYSLASGKPFGGWIVINKATGNLKVLEINDVVHDTLKEEYKKEIEYKVRYIVSNKPIPPCKGVIEEFFRKKPTGNKILNRDCEWCSHKNKCHEGLQELPEAFSEAKERKTRYYIGKVNYPKEKEL